MKKLSMLFAIAIILCSCSSSFQVTGNEMTPNVDYKQYKTFKFIKVEPSNLMPPLNMDYVAIVQNTMKDRMAERGFVYASDTTVPDLLINLGFMVEKKTAADDVTSPAEAYFLGDMDYSWTISPKQSSLAGNQRTYKQGIILFDIVDKNKKSLLWRGSVTSELGERINEAQRETNLIIAVNQLFSVFPGTNK